MTDIYELLIALSYFPASEIIFAPPPRHEINKKLCLELKLTPEVISLMRRLPYPRGLERRPIFPFGSVPWDQLHDENLKMDRDPESWECMDFSLQQDVVLGVRMERVDEDVILDTKESTSQLLITISTTLPRTIV